MAKKTKKQKFKEFKEYFPDLLDKEIDYFSLPKMEDLMKSTGCDIINAVYLDHWSGDALMILKRDKEFGLLIFGYGSCSGCDALQACENYKDLFDLRENRYSSVMWKDYNDFIEYLKHKDWDAEFFCAGDKEKKKLIKGFVKEAKSKMLMTYLSGI